MRLSQFIAGHQPAILTDWVAFAGRQLPAAEDLDHTELLDHGKALLEAIVADMRTPQGEQERQAKSEGDEAGASTSVAEPSRSHARQRERQGFEIEQMVAEYRALRATVLRQWSQAAPAEQPQDLEDVIRFNEAVDKALAESLAVFVAEVARTRELFIGLLGHDLRGPLGTIANCAHLDLRQRPDDTRQATVVLRSVAQMRALLDDLVEYTRDRLGDLLPVDPAPLSLGPFARNLLDEIGAIKTGHPLALHLRGHLAGEWDARRLHQALSNLVFNALKYGTAGTPVDVHIDGTGTDTVVIAVHNAGAPIPAHLLPRLFDPLVRSDGETGPSGVPLGGANLGLGLYVVREVAKAHGGRVEVCSDAEGTRFELHLPRIVVRPPSLRRAPAQP